MSVVSPGKDWYYWLIDVWGLFLIVLRETHGIEIDRGTSLKSTGSSALRYIPGYRIVAVVAVVVNDKYILFLQNLALKTKSDSILKLKLSCWFLLFLEQ